MRHIAATSYATHCCDVICDSPRAGHCVGVQPPNVYPEENDVITSKYTCFYIFYKMLMQQLILWEKQTCVRDGTMNSRLYQYKMWRLWFHVMPFPRPIKFMNSETRYFKIYYTLYCYSTLNFFPYFAQSKHAPGWSQNKVFEIQASQFFGSVRAAWWVWTTGGSAF